MTDSEKLDLLLKKFSGMEDRFSGMEDRFSGLEDRVSSLEDKVSVMDTKLTATRLEIENNIWKAIDIIGGNHQDLCRKLDAFKPLDKKVKSHEVRLDAVEFKVNRMEQKIA